MAIKHLEALPCGNLRANSYCPTNCVPVRQTDVHDCPNFGPWALPYPVNQSSRRKQPPAGSHEAPGRQWPSLPLEIPTNRQEQFQPILMFTRLLPSFVPSIVVLPSAVLFLVVSAQLEIELPISKAGIPITGQSLAVLLVGFLLPPPRGACVVAIYLLLGAFGLPVFADGGAGIAVIRGGSGGYLAGFLVASLMMGMLGQRGWGSSFRWSLLAMTMGTIVILALGVARLTMIYNFDKAMAYGLYPFAGGAIVKIVLGAAITPAVWRFRSFVGVARAK